MASKVFVHIGAPKTGTTYLQQLMAANRDALAGQGVLYADGAFAEDRVWATRIVRGFDLSDHPRPEAKGAWDRILTQVHEWEGPAVISHEFFGALTAEQARRMQEQLAPAEVHVVFTARDYVRQFAAVWQERLKYGHSTRLRDFSLDRNGTPLWSWRTQDVVAILERWRNDLPVSRVHVVTVPPPGEPAGLLWERFAEVIGVDPASCTTRLPAVNTSLGLVEAELLRRVDEKLAPELPEVRERAAWIRGLLANSVLARTKGERFGVPAEVLPELTRSAEQAVKQLADEGYDVVGSLDDLIPRPQEPSRQPEDLTAEELLDAAVVAISELVLETRKRVEHQVEENRRLRQQRRRLLAAEAGAGQVSSAPPPLGLRARRKAGRAIEVVRRRLGRSGAAS